MLSAQRADGTIDIDQLDRSITFQVSEGARGEDPRPRHDSKDLETLRLSVLGHVLPQPAGGRAGGGSAPAVATFAPYSTSPQTAAVVQRSAGARGATVEAGDAAAAVRGTQPRHKRRHEGDSGKHGRSGGCCGSRPR
eukprot:COSAG03_NODE_298_length_9236_cov_126.932253_10_plen_137_part_00